MKKLLLLSLLVLASCTQAPPVTQAPVSSQGPAIAAPTASGAVAAVNALRAEAGRAPLRDNAQLRRAASAHASDMARNGFFDHAGSDGSNVGDRVRRAGYRWCGAAENIALGQPDLNAVLTAWMGSSGHRRNLLDGKMQEMGLVEGPGQTWVMVLARPC